jgi:glycosyltransferase involved in cell wall biosynthesis
MRIAVVMTYYDRQLQLNRTLKTIAKTRHNDFEVIIVDDCSPETPVIDFHDFKITVLRTENKQWIDGSPAYNLGIREALKNKADIIILQNAECYHYGDIIRYANDQITEDNYLSFACYNLSREWTLRGHDLSWIVTNHNVPACDNEGNAWLNHSLIRPMPYHWCSAITAKNMRLLNGFDERFSDGYWYEDDELLARIRMLGLNVNIVDSPFVVHQWHERNYVPENRNELIEKNRMLFEQVKKGNFRAEHRFTKDV